MTVSAPAAHSAELSGMTWGEFARDAFAMGKATGRSWAQMMLAANTPLLLRADLVDRIVAEAAARIVATSATLRT